VQAVISAAIYMVELPDFLLHYGFTA